MYLICHVTSHDHLIEWTCELMGGSSLGYVTTLISFVTISFYDGGNMFLICHRTSREHIFKCEFMGGS